MPPTDDVSALLASLFARLSEDAVLADEWTAAARAWPGELSDPDSGRRFAQWFLFERPSEALGAPPAVAWAPAEVGPLGTDPWASLLGSRFGFWEVLGPSTEGAAHGVRFRDLATGAEAEVPTAPSALPVGGMVVGRLAPEDAGDVGRFLPGAWFVHEPRLRDALREDLAAARRRQPGARPSQEAAERWLQALGGGPMEVAAGDGASRPADDGGGDDHGGAAESFTAFRAALERALLGAPGWDADRVVELLRRHGPGEALDRLAFDTEADLETLRRLFAEHAGAWESPEAPAHRPQPLTAVDEDAVDPEAVARALRVFEEDREAGVPANLAAERMAESLGLPPEPMPWDAEREDFGPTEALGLTPALEAWRWEEDRAGRPPTASEWRAVEELVGFVEGLRRGRVEPFELAPHEVFAHLMASPDPETLRARLADLRRFLGWMAREQQAPLEGLLSEWDREVPLRVGAALRTSPEAAAEGPGTPAVERVVAIAPVRVGGGEDAEVTVSGLTPEVESVVRVGDRLAGRWREGGFLADRFLPGELFPEDGAAGDPQAGTGRGG